MDLGLISTVKKFQGEVVAGSKRERDIVSEIKGELEDQKVECRETPVKVISFMDKGSYISGIKGFSVLPYSPTKSGRGKLRSEIELVNLINPLEANYYYYRAVERGKEMVFFCGDKYLRKFTIGYGFPFSSSYSPLPIPAIYVKEQECNKLPEQVEFSINTSLVESYGYNIEAVMPGKEEEFVLIGANHDHWFTGTHNNSLGSAVLLVLARLLGETKYTTRIVSFTAKESGSMGFSSFPLLYGSSQYVKNLKLSGKIDKLISAIIWEGVFSNPNLSCSYSLEKAFSFPLSHLTPYSDDFPFLLEGIPTCLLSSHSPLANSDGDNEGIFNENMMREYFTEFLNGVKKIIQGIVKPDYSVYTKEILRITYHPPLRNIAVKIDDLEKAGERAVLRQIFSKLFSVYTNGKWVGKVGLLPDIFLSLEFLEGNYSGEVYLKNGIPMPFNALSRNPEIRDLVKKSVEYFLYERAEDYVEEINEVISKHILKLS
jgi:Predicted aminopeptidase, Iap family